MVKGFTQMQWEGGINSDIGWLLWDILLTKINNVAFSVNFHWKIFNSIWVTSKTLDKKNCIKFSFFEIYMIYFYWCYLQNQHRMGDCNLKIAATRLFMKGGNLSQMVKKYMYIYICMQLSIIVFSFCL